MAEYYSDHYTATVSGNTQDDPRIKVAAGLSHGKLHYKRATVTTDTDTAAADILRFFQLKSGDRLLELRLSMVADGGTSGTFDAGLHATDEGAVIDIDLFCAFGTAPGDDITTAAARVDLFALAALENEDRGKQLWQLADEGGGTYSVDPFEVWDITITIKAEVAIAGAEFVMEAYYVPGSTA